MPTSLSRVLTHNASNASSSVDADGAETVDLTVFTLDSVEVKKGRDSGARPRRRHIPKRDSNNTSDTTAAVSVSPDQIREQASMYQEHILKLKHKMSNQ